METGDGEICAVSVEPREKVRRLRRSSTIRWHFGVMSVTARVNPLPTSRRALPCAEAASLTTGSRRRRHILTSSGRRS
jgi:hypothetical protein